MTELELKVYRLEARTMLLERVFASLSIGLLMKAGLSAAQSRAELVAALEREGTMIRAEIPSLSQGDPARNALLTEEFNEIVESLKTLAHSLR